MDKLFYRIFYSIADMKEFLNSKADGRMTEGDYHYREIIPERVINMSTLTQRLFELVRT